jgi:chromosome partitioning protein
MQRIVVLNPKGGSGKTTIAINLVGYYAARGEAVVLVDHDPQGSALRWVRKRRAPLPVIHPIAACASDNRMTRSWLQRIPIASRRIVVDTAAALEAQMMPQLTREATHILVPVLPSDIDLHAASRCVADLLLVAKVRRTTTRIGVIANRVRRNTLAYQSLLRFLDTLGIPVVATIRDSQNYTRSAELGMGIHEMKRYVAREDVADWESLVAWLDERPAADGGIAAAVPAEALGPG